MQTLLPEYKSANPAKVKIAKARTAISSIGLVIPFHPSMQDEKTSDTLLSNAAEAVKIKMKDSYEDVCISKVLERIKKIFNQLNYNTHRKSIAVILKPDEDNVTYLDFPVKPVTYLNKYVSLLELTANADQQPDFYYLVLQENSAALYEYHHNQLNRVYATKQEPGLNEKTKPDSLFKQVSQTIERINNKNEKPVFVTGSPNLVELFCNSPYYSHAFFTLLYELAPDGEEIIKRLVKEITSHWNYWFSNFITGRIMMAQKANSLISNVEAVLNALSHSFDGLLLIDKRLKRQLYKSRKVNTLFNSADELMNQVEKFLSRGNRIEITETGLLKNFGGIVLLQKNTSPLLETISTRCQAVSNTGTMF